MGISIVFILCAMYRYCGMGH